MIKDRNISITENSPVYNSYQVSEEFIKFLNDKDGFLFLNFPIESKSILLIKRKHSNGYFDLFTPIHFPILFQDGFWEENIYSVINLLEQTNCLSLYLQTKNSISIENLPVNISIDTFRTNYYFDLSIEMESLRLSQARDSRQRLNKVLKQNYCVLSDSVDLSDFYYHYSRIAKNKEFNQTYRNSQAQFEALLSNKCIEYLEIRDEDGKFLSGGFFASSGDIVDYLYGSESNKRQDVIRLLIFEALRFFKTKKKKWLFLGGGVKEEDSLAIFKKRMGTIEQKCSTIRCITNIEIAENIMDQKFNQNWFQGYFPPYFNKVNVNE